MQAQMQDGDNEEEEKEEKEEKGEDDEENEEEKEKEEEMKVDDEPKRGQSDILKSNIKKMVKSTVKRGGKNRGILA